MLELEESQEKKDREQQAAAQARHSADAATETEPMESSTTPDSGCVSMQHSRAPSVGREEDLPGVMFQDQKIQETQSKLHALVREVSGPSSKSLLLQTVALFEALLARIKELQGELAELRKKEKEEVKREEEDDKRGDELVLEIECLSRELANTKEELGCVNKKFDDERQSRSKLEEEARDKKEDLDKKDEVQRRLSVMQSKVEEDLRRQVGGLSQKLEATLMGCRSESEMHGESMLKVAEFERQISSVQCSKDELRKENLELREQLSALLEQHASKSSTGSLSSDLGEPTAEKPPSSGIGSDLSDSETSDSQHSSLRSRSSSPEKRFSTESGVFDLSVSCAETQTTEQYLREIASLTEEVEKLTAFRDLVETRLVLPSTAPMDEEKEATPVNEDEDEAVNVTLTALETRLAELTEEKCELEEAENDSRLRAQVAESEVLKMKDALRRVEEDLSVERKAVKHLRASWEQKEQVASDELSCLEEALARAESRGHQLEESRGGLITSLDLLLKGVTIWSYVHHHRHCLRPLASLQQPQEPRSARRPADSPVTEEEPNCKRMRMGCGGACQAEELESEVRRLEEERLLLACSHADDQERLQQHEAQLELLEREVHEARKAWTREQAILEMQQKDEVRQLREASQEIEGKARRMKELVEGVEQELNGQHGDSVVEKVRQLVENEARLAQEVEEHEKKELAFRETLSEADVIMSSIEQGYHSRVTELEETRRQLEDRLAVLEEAEGRLQQALRGKLDAGQVSHLLERLGQLEKTELCLKEKVTFFEKTQRQVGLRLADEQKLVADLREELKEREELVVRIAEQEVEVNRLECEVQRLREVEFRHGELAQSEEFLRGRVEELEGVEQSLRDTMATVAQAAAMRERRLEDRLARMSEELEQQSSDVTSYEDACYVMRGEEGGLRQEIQTLHSEAEEARRREAAMVEAEEELRGELAKARGTVERINSQLAELDRHNCEMRGQLALREEEVAKLHRELEVAAEAVEQVRQEQQKAGEQLERLQARKEERRSFSRSGSEELELDEIARSEGGLVAVTKEVAEAAAMVTGCRECSPALSGRLAEAAAQLSVLSNVICGGEEGSGMRGELLRCESEEYLVRSEDVSTEEEEEMLSNQLVELQEKLDRMEAEMTIVSEESRELADNLEEREVEILMKVRVIVEMLCVNVVGKGSTHKGTVVHQTRCIEHTIPHKPTDSTYTPLPGPSPSRLDHQGTPVSRTFLEIFSSDPAGRGG